MIGDDTLKFLIAAGGTAGHINPGISIAKEIKKNNPDAIILFVGTERGFEKDLVQKAGFNIKFINVKGFKRKISFDTLLSVKELFQGMFQSRIIIKEFAPDIVIGTGGYVCGPVLMNASILKIPTIIHEQNAFPGMTNKILSKYVNKVLISFEESRKHFKSNNLLFTGNPVSDEIRYADRKSSRIKLGIKDNEKMILCYGGSNGAQKINNSIIEYIKKGIGRDKKIIFGTGKLNYEAVLKELESANLANVEVLSYIYNMHEVMAASDVVICRSGAITLSEITCIGIPSILIPSPNVTNNHQEYNARALEKENAAKVILESELQKMDFKEYIEILLNDEKQLTAMAKNSKKIGNRDSNLKIYLEIMELLK